MSLGQQFFPRSPNVFKNPLDLFDAIVSRYSRGDLEHALRQQLDDSQFDLSPAHDSLKNLPWQAV
ncbi:MAG: hypothetical protein WC655_18775, partial [Candidatus Hydrogenedentales bacterium]